MAYNFGDPMYDQYGSFLGNYMGGGDAAPAPAPYYAPPAPQPLAQTVSSLGANSGWDDFYKQQAQNMSYVGAAPAPSYNYSAPAPVAAPAPGAGQGTMIGANMTGGDSTFIQPQTADSFIRGLDWSNPEEATRLLNMERQAQGWTNDQIGAGLGFSANDVQNHFAKYGYGEAAPAAPQWLQNIQQNPTNSMMPLTQGATYQTGSGGFGMDAETLGYIPTSATGGTYWDENTGQMITPMNTGSNGSGWTPPDATPEYRAYEPVEGGKSGWFTHGTNSGKYNGTPYTSYDMQGQQTGTGTWSDLGDGISLGTGLLSTFGAAAAMGAGQYLAGAGGAAPASGSFGVVEPASSFGLSGAGSSAATAAGASELGNAAGFVGEAPWTATAGSTPLDFGAAASGATAPATSGVNYGLQAPGSYGLQAPATLADTTASLGAGAAEGSALAGNAAQGLQATAGAAGTGTSGIAGTAVGNLAAPAAGSLGGGLGLQAGLGTGLTLAAPAAGSLGGGLGLQAGANAIAPGLGTTGLASGTASLLPEALQPYTPTFPTPANPGTYTPTYPTPQNPGSGPGGPYTPQYPGAPSPTTPPSTPTTPTVPKVPGAPGSGGGGTGSGGSGGMGLGDLLGLLGAAYGGKQRSDASKEMLAWLNGQQAKVDNLYKPGSPEHELMKQEMERKDAAAGRNSQYGTRAVDLAAKIAGIKADHTSRLTTGIGHTYAAALNQGADAYAGLPAVLGAMNGAAGPGGINLGNGLNLGQLTNWLGGLFGSGGGSNDAPAGTEDVLDWWLRNGSGGD